jgi:hypothetical protein
MNTMPGFTADVALYKDSGRYHVVGFFGYQTGGIGILPQRRPMTMFEC